jgi:hypothetical protein
MLDVACLTTTYNGKSSRHSFSPVENEGRRSRTVPSRGTGITSSGKFPTCRERPVEHAAVPLECKKRSIDRSLKHGTMDLWRRHAEIGVTRGIALPLFYSAILVLHGDRRVRQTHFSRHPKKRSGSKKFLPVFGRCRSKCTASHKLPIALSGLGANNVRHTHFGRSSWSSVNVQEAGAY